MKILLVGKQGQLGYELERSLQCLGSVIAVDRAQMDLTNPNQMRSIIRTIRPALIVNAAGYTSVDLAEAEPSVAIKVNGEAPAIMAEEAKLVGAAMIHYSTDYVFDGCKTGPYKESDTPNPLNVYGRTKLMGEQAIQSAEIPYLIFRISWIYGKRGKNFLTTILELANLQQDLYVVNDQIGSPTWSRTVAEATSHVVAKLSAFSRCSSWRSALITHPIWRKHSGIYHLSAGGKTSWWAFAQAILASSKIEGDTKVIPITSNERNSPATRPANSELSCEKFSQTFFCNLPQWEASLSLCLK